MPSAVIKINERLSIKIKLVYENTLNPNNKTDKVANERQIFRIA